MPTVVGVVTLVALIGFYAVTGAAPEPAEAPTINAEAGATVPHRAQFNYSAPARVEVVQVLPVQTVLSPRVTNSKPPSATKPSAAVAVPTPNTEPVPPQETPTSACVGKPAGSACTLGTQNGTCITPAFSPMTCVLH